MDVVADPVTPDGESAAVAAEAVERVRAYLRSHPDGPATLRLVDDEDEQFVVPRGAVELFFRVLAHMASGDSVSVVSGHTELTTQQAADLLHVSRPYLIGLLDAGEIAYRRVGSHRRVHAGSLLDYKRRDDAQRNATLDELTSLAQDMDLG